MIRHHKKGIESKIDNESALIKDLPCKIVLNDLQS